MTQNNQSSQKGSTNLYSGDCYWACLFWTWCFNEHSREGSLSWLATQSFSKQNNISSTPAHRSLNEVCLWTFKNVDAFWKCVVWSVEIKLECSPHVNMVVGSIMLWGCFAASGTGKLVCVMGSWKKYIGILMNDTSLALYYHWVFHQESVDITFMITCIQLGPKPLEGHQHQDPGVMVSDPKSQGLMSMPENHTIWMCWSNLPLKMVKSP